MKKILFLAFVVFLQSAVAAQAQTQPAYDRVTTSGTIQCGYFTWPPYVVKDPNTGALSGINYDIMMEIGRVLDLKINWKEEVSPGTVIEGLNTGRYDVMCATVLPDAPRLKNSMMSNPTFYSTAYIVTRADDTRFDNGKTSINAKNIAVAGIESDITATMARNHYPEATHVNLPQTADSAQLMQMLITKKADVILVDKGTVADFNKTNDKKLKVAVGTKPVEIFSENLALQKDEIKLTMLLNHALRMMIDNGKVDEFVKKYSNYNYYAPQKSWHDLAK